VSSPSHMMAVLLLINIRCAENTSTLEYLINQSQVKRAEAAMDIDANAG
jgi:hypothetical protein